MGGGVMNVIDKTQMKFSVYENLLHLFSNIYFQIFIFKYLFSNIYFQIFIFKYLFF